MRTLQLATRTASLPRQPGKTLVSQNQKSEFQKTVRLVRVFDPRQTRCFTSRSCKVLNSRAMRFLVCIVCAPIQAIPSSLQEAAEHRARGLTYQ